MTAAILFVSHSAELNGAERMLLDLIRGLDRKKFKPTLIIPEKGPLGSEAEKARCETQIIPMKWQLTGKAGLWKQPFSSLYNQHSVSHIMEAALSRKSSIIFSNSAAVFSGALAARRLGIPHIWSIHEILEGNRASLFSIMGTKRLARMIGNLSCSIAVSSQAALRPFRQFSHAKVVYNGIALPAKTYRTRQEIRQSMGLKKSDFVLATAGKIYPGKGQKEGILAVEKLRRAFPHIKYLIVGSARKKRHLRDLRRLVGRCGLQGSVIFTGYVPDIFTSLQAVDLYLTLSRVESFGRTAVEAMAVGIPVLALNAGGHAEIITNGQNGFIVDSADPDTVRAAVEAVHRNPDLAAGIVENARKIYKEKFSLKAHIKHMEDIILRCLPRT